MDATLPGPQGTDSENVVWLLSTAQSLWGKGERAEALRWLERAANAARDDGQTSRADTLLAQARILAAAGPVAAKPAGAPAMKKMFERTMQSKPPADGEDPRATPVVVRHPEPPPVASIPAETRVSGQVPSDPPQVLSSSDLDVEPSGTTTRRFDYPDALAALAKPSGAGKAAAPALPDDVLPAIRVWIVAGAVVPAVGPRPAGAADAILVSAAPGVDLVAALAAKAQP